MKKSGKTLSLIQVAVCMQEDGTVRMCGIDAKGQVWIYIQQIEGWIYIPMDIMEND